MAEKPTVFTRTASGLVRRISTLDIFLGGMAFINVAASALILTWGIIVFPYADMLMGLLISIPLCAIVNLAYVFLTASMPRSGGDYVFMSRIINPAVGFVMNFNLTFWFISWWGLTAYIVPTWFLGPMFAAIGVATGNTTWLSYAHWFATNPLAIILVGAIIVLINWLVFVGPVQNYFRVQRVLVPIGLIAAFIVIGLIAVTGSAGFVGAWNQLAAASGTLNYTQVIAQATSAGWPLNPTTTLFDTIGFASVVGQYTIWSYCSTYFAGEIKSAHSVKTLAIGMVGSCVATTLILFAIVAASLHTFGREFLAAASYLYNIAYYGQVAPFPVQPLFHAFGFLLTTSVPLIIFLAIAFTSYIYLWYASVTLQPTRSIFAWAFDGLAPRWMASVSKRWRSPSVAVTVVALIGFVWVILYALPTTTIGVYTLNYLAYLMTFLTVAVGMFAAIIFPWAKKEIYDVSPVKKYKIGGFPVVSLVGIIGFAWVVFICYTFLVMPIYGLVGPYYARLGPIPVIALIPVEIAIGIILYYVARWNRKRKGIDISLAYKEVPPA